MDKATINKLRKIALRCNDHRTTDALDALIASAVNLQAPVAPCFGMQLTPWFSPRRKEFPVRDGLYIARLITQLGASEMWYVLRWNSIGMAWYSADSDGTRSTDLINGSANNVMQFEWRGFFNGGAA